jgi:hypothetical protein
MLFCVNFFLAPVLNRERASTFKILFLFGGNFSIANWLRGRQPKLNMIPEKEICIITVRKETPAQLRFGTEGKNIKLAAK